MVPVADLSSSRFQAPTVCRVAEISADTLKNWVNRRPAVVPLTEKDRVASARGAPILYSFQRVLQVAITADLVRRFRLKPRHAASIAFGFTDYPSASKGRDADGSDLGPRMPGELFASGETVLIVREIPDDDDAVVVADCRSVEFHTPLGRVLGGGAGDGLVVNVSTIHRRVVAGLSRTADNA